jgi:hypothetical protein
MLDLLGTIGDLLSITFPPRVAICVTLSIGVAIILGVLFQDWITGLLLGGPLLLLGLGSGYYWEFRHLRRK